MLGRARFRFWPRCLLLERDVLMEVSIQMAVWWQVASEETVITILMFNVILKTEAAGCCETLTAIYHTTMNYLRKDCNTT